MIRQEEYRQRRQRLAQQLPPGSVALIAAAGEQLRNGDTHYRFRQASDFYYLTGFNEPDALLLILAGDDGDSLLFNRPHNAAEEQWTGRRLGQEGACRQLGMKQAFSIDDLATKLPECLAGKSTVYCAIGTNQLLDERIAVACRILKKQARRGVQAPDTFCDIEPLTSEMRLFKSPGEIELMRRAASISVAAHKRAMRACQSLSNESQLEAELLYEFSRNGCRSMAYDAIVGGGENACILHYTDNNQPLQAGELVLIDAGGEFENYAADITRTFPINGRFSPEQRAIYDLVLKAQQAGIALIKPGLAWPAVQACMVRILTEGLCELGLLQGDVDHLIETGGYRPFYMHNSGHWLGLDVHDCGAYKIDGEWRLLQPGMVLTVEPGLYISANMPGVDPRWWNIGVRIEDDILVTADGHDNLTGDLPVLASEIEALMRG